MLIKETELPGIGKKFQIETRSGDKMVIVVHDDGRREIYHFDSNDPEESISMVTLDDAEARRVAGILGGMAYVPKALETVEMALDDMVFEWYKVEKDAQAIGKTIGDLEIRKKTGAAIIAIIKKDEKVLNPGPEEIITPGATIVVLGDRKQVKACKELILHGGI
ncbi:cation:proton antiporter regulatory subunit [Neomoorella thermoacetica]|uniref:Potassium/proton antiporter regulatory subunit, CPA2 family n=1 Tax=Moorella thermoacetica (strain ATCC 39073 / JCM 9320) TaxID=264732 RepID=Q2RGS8_MOOTA|nr:cation:proton antiporter regulatory subunit [Moorella thermoacetica]AKX94899.1 K(+)/H(+) antiporter subunit KhtT [Moorella thermoacetica]AKX97528.1 K(+)/H(+) antiporter subunit KhtT [Moorella thermoacetica]OIQ52771.1 K(+)/H(+) antiporter subunit KhtT [Moorella thermoacetica]OIQ54780.1 K(+)/H(+) antiporter subunit KhtT [Moorella thermoacetica]QDA01355.1 K(+)/H(+) antiporter subunit KhtT [Moorella thermoacetica]